jgi:MYXO-CTERM domain-containing protein
MSFTTNSPSDLIAGVIAAGSGQSLNYVISGPGSNPNNSPLHRAYLSFGDTPVSSFSLYSFSDRPQSHRVTLFQGIIEVAAVPEPAAAALGLLGGLFLLRRRR